MDVQLSAEITALFEEFREKGNKGSARSGRLRLRAFKKVIREEIDPTGMIPDVRIARMFHEAIVNSGSATALTPRSFERLVRNCKPLLQRVHEAVAQKREEDVATHLHLFVRYNQLW